MIEDFKKITCSSEDIKNRRLSNKEMYNFKSLDCAETLGRLFVGLANHFGVENVDIRNGEIKVWTNEKNQNSFLSDVLGIDLRDVKTTIEWQFKRVLVWNDDGVDRYMVFYSEV